MSLTLEGDVLRGRRITPGAVTVTDGVVADGGPPGAVRVLPEGWIVAAGFVDLQVNGYGGAQVGEDPDEIARAARTLPDAYPNYLRVLERQHEGLEAFVTATQARWCSSPPPSCPG